MSAKSSPKQNPGCLASILRLFGIRPGIPGVTITHLPGDPIPDELPFRLRDDFLSPAEHSFYLVVKGILVEHLTICPKVSLGDLFFVVRPNENMSAYNRINRKHVDFLICEPKTLQPLFAIELDDSSHQRSDRAERDDFVEQVFQVAGLPLLHVPVRANYNTAELGQLFKGALQKKQAAAAPASPSTPASPVSSEPVCPKCGVPMVLRTARTGQQAGRQFYGCPNYPKCRIILPVEKPLHQDAV